VGVAGKKMEGNEEQRRKKAREAKRAGQLPSERGATYGASKQRKHLPHDEDHVEKLETIRQGKQPVLGHDVSTPRPRPRSRP
jgi:ribosomal protein L25 (general stress protein Ctc)